MSGLFGAGIPKSYCIIVAHHHVPLSRAVFVIKKIDFSLPYNAMGTYDDYSCVQASIFGTTDEMAMHIAPVLCDIVTIHTH